MKRMKELLQSMKNHSHLDNMSVVLRHADRDRIFDPRDVFKVPLNEDGKAKARRFGRLLEVEKAVELRHSPVPRCRQTAELILEGFLETGGEGRMGLPDQRLACDYIGDNHRLFPIFNELGSEGFIRKWFENKISEEIIGDPHEVSDVLARYLKESSSKERVTIHVTHDWNVLLLRSIVFGNAGENGWPGFMEGVVVVGDSHGQKMVYPKAHESFSNQGLE